VNLQTIVDALDQSGLLVETPAALPQISGVAEDSRKVSSGTLFCAIRGTAQDGHQYVEDARRRGASAAIVVHKVDPELPQIVVNDSRLAAAIAAREWYGNPSVHMRLIGVTGTNGKSTTVSILRHLLNRDGTGASIGTLGAFDGSGARLAGYGSLTTPGAVEFQAVLADLRYGGVTDVALEASSHGLHQRRLDAVSFRAGVYTNLTHEHLDYHRDLESYAAAKMRLSQLLVSGGIEVVNADDPTWRKLPRRTSLRRIFYGRGPDAEVRVIREELGASGAECVFLFGNAEHRVTVPLIGEYNVTNAVAAAAAVWGLGMDPSEIALRLATSPQVPGRMEVLAAGAFTVLRDYAHTPDGFERAIRAVRDITPGRLTVLFGCGGDRDRSKRPEMGRIAAAGSDLVVIAMDNPRTEDPELILNDIERGLGNAPHLRITDREAAIGQAISLLRDGDCLLLLGKGHETYQIVGEEKLPFDEPSIVRAAVARLQ